MEDGKEKKTKEREGKNVCMTELTAQGSNRLLLRANGFYSDFLTNCGARDHQGKVARSLLFRPIAAFPLSFRLCSGTFGLLREICAVPRMAMLSLSQSAIRSAEDKLSHP